MEKNTASGNTHRVVTLGGAECRYPYDTPALQMQFPSEYNADVNPNTLKMIQEDKDNPAYIGYMFSGISGSGKTTLAQIMYEYYRKKYFLASKPRGYEDDPIWISAWELYARYKKRDFRTEYDILCTRSIAVLDDLGTEPHTDQAHHYMSTVINSFYEYQQKGYPRRLIITTNLEQPTLIRYYTLRTVDRLVELCKIRRLKDISFRMMKEDFQDENDDAQLTIDM